MPDRKATTEHSITRLPPMSLRNPLKRSVQCRAAFALIVELNDERRLSTTEVLLLLAGLFDVPFTGGFERGLAEHVALGPTDERCLPLWRR